MRDTQRQSRDALLLSLRRLSHDALVCRLKSLTARERRSTALLVAHLAELDTRDVYLRAGFSSLFTYCRDVLALSDDEAYSRIVAARTARRFPVVLDLLAAGDVNVTMVRMLGPHLTAENHLAVLEEARGKRKADVEEIVARLSPRPDIRPSVRKLPEPKGVRTAALQHEIGQADPHCPAATTPAAPPAAGHHAISTGTAERTTDPLGLAAAPVAAAGPAHEAESVLWPASRQAANVQPLSPDRYKYQLTIGASTLEKLRLAKDMLRHALPSGDDEAVLDRALTALLRDLARKKLGAEPTNTSSRKGTGAIHEPTVGAGSPGGADSRHIPVEVKRAVWLRDLGRCAFIAADGHRCGERAFVEFHHVRPHAVGGRSTVDNIQLRCWRHNGYEARVFFGREPVSDERPRELTNSHERRVQAGEAGPQLISRGADATPDRRSGTAARDCAGVSERGVA